MSPKTERDRRTKPTNSKLRPKGSSEDQSYYSLLQISRDAEEGEIRKAYKKLAMKWHPDKNRDDPEKATEMFKLVAEAFEVLSDPEKREIYDKYGKEGLKNGVSSRNFNGFEFDFNDAASIFERFFGNSHFGGSNDFFNSAFNDPFFRQTMHSHSNGRRNGMNTGGFMSMGTGFNGMGGGFGFDFGSDFGTFRSGNGGFETMESFSSGSGGQGGVSKSTKRSTRIVNGKKVTKTETTIRYADGHVETTSNETTEDVGGGRLGNGQNNGQSSKSRLGWF